MEDLILPLLLLYVASPAARERARRQRLLSEAPGRIPHLGEGPSTVRWMLERPRQESDPWWLASIEIV